MKRILLRTIMVLLAIAAATIGFARGQTPPTVRMAEGT